MQLAMIMIASCTAIVVQVYPGHTLLDTVDSVKQDVARRCAEDAAEAMGKTIDTALAVLANRAQFKFAAWKLT